MKRSRIRPTISALRDGPRQNRLMHRRDRRIPGRVAVGEPAEHLQRIESRRAVDARPGVPSVDSTHAISPWMWKSGITLRQRSAVVSRSVRRMFSAVAQTFPCSSGTILGREVVPEVCRTRAMSSGPAMPSARCGGPLRRTPRIRRCPRGWRARTGSPERARPESPRRPGPASRRPRPAPPPSPAGPTGRTRTRAGGRRGSAGRSWPRPRSRRRRSPSRVRWAARSPRGRPVRCPARSARRPSLRPVAAGRRRSGRGGPGRRRRCRRRRPGAVRGCRLGMVISGE